MPDIDLFQVQQLSARKWILICEGRVERSSVRVLVVDDFAPWRHFFCSILRKAGIQAISQTADGFEGVQKAKEQQPDLILLDIGLPGLSGLDVGKQIRKLAPRAKILFVSQESSTDFVREAVSLGALGYVHKSNAGTELLPAIQAVLAGGRFLTDSLKNSQVAGSTDSHAHRHEILVFADDATLVDGFAHFVGNALNAGNPAIALVAESHRGSLLHKLRAHGVDVDAAAQEGSYVSLDAAEDLDPERFVEIVRSAIEATTKTGKTGHSRVAFCGERAGRLWAQGNAEAAIHIERFCEELTTKYNIDILCGYPSGSLAADYGKEAFNAVYASHSPFIPIQQPILLL